MAETTTNTGSGTTSDGVRVVVQVEPAPPNAERIADLSLMFALALPVLITIWGAKQLLNFFSTNPHED